MAEEEAPKLIVPIRLIYGPLDGATIYEEWEEGEAKDIRIAWVDFQSNAFSDSPEFQVAVKVNIPREAGMNVRGIARYVRDGFTAYHVPEKKQ